MTALGELLIDFTENGLSNQGNPAYEANPGGAPCNVLAMLSNLGYKTAFIGKVGDDQFGQKRKEEILEAFIRNSRIFHFGTLSMTLDGVSILKISDNEILWLTGIDDYSEGINWILERYPIPLIFLTMEKTEAGLTIMEQ